MSLILTSCNTSIDSCVFQIGNYLPSHSHVHLVSFHIYAWLGVVVGGSIAFSAFNAREDKSCSSFGYLLSQIGDRIDHGGAASQVTKQRRCWQLDQTIGSNLGNLTAPSFISHPWWLISNSSSPTCQFSFRNIYSIAAFKLPHLNGIRTEYLW